MKWKVLATACAALLFSGSLQAGLSALNVQFSPNAAVFSSGQVIDVTATGNGTETRYYYDLAKVVLGGAAIIVDKTVWSSSGAYHIDTAALNLPNGEYRLRVYAREAANKRETLVKTEFFTISAPAPLACDLIDGKTYTNPAAVSPTLDFGCPGFMCLGLNLEMLSGIALTSAANAAGVTSLSFDSGVVSAVLKPVNVITGVGNGSIVPSGALTGTYTCSGNTINVNASLTNSLLSGASGLVSLLGGSPIPLSLSGSFNLDTVQDTLSAGLVSFE